MKWSLQQLMKITSFPSLFETQFDFSNDIDIVEDILSIGVTQVKGTINRVDSDTYQFNYHISVKLALACALTLEEVPYQLELDIEEVYSKNPDEEMFLIEGNTIDLKPMVWANIIVAIPIRVVRDDAYEILEARNIVLNPEIPDEDE